MLDEQREDGGNSQLALQGSPQNASVVAFQSGDPDGVWTPLAIAGGKDAFACVTAGRLDGGG